MSERDLQQDFSDWLTKNGLPHFRQRMDKRTTGTLGWPDFTICHNGRVLLIEAKFEKGSLRKSQNERRAELDAAGCHVHVLRDLQSAINVVNEWRSQGADRVPVNHPAHRPTVPWKGIALRELPDGSFERIKP